MLSPRRRAQTPAAARPPVLSALRHAPHSLATNDGRLTGTSSRAPELHGNGEHPRFTDDSRTAIATRYAVNDRDVSLSKPTQLRFAAA